MRIGVDIGGSGLRAAVVDGRAPGPMRQMRNDDRSLEAVLAALEQLVGPLGPHPVGIAVPGYVEAGVVRGSPNFPRWRDVPLEQLASQRLGRTVRICNDADAAALGVAAELDLQDVVVLTLGTGVGGGVVLGGRLLGGRASGELGHLWTGGERPCGCGSVGCLETRASASAVRVRAGELGLPVDLDRLARTTDADHPVWAELIEALAHGLRDLANCFGPQALALTGGLCVARAPLERAIARFREEVIDVHRELPVHLLGRADRYAVLGAAQSVGKSVQDAP